MLQNSIPADSQMFIIIFLGGRIENKSLQPEVEIGQWQVLAVTTTGPAGGPAGSSARP